MCEEIRCPACGSIEIIYHDIIDEHIDLSTVYQTWEGHCGGCGATLMWEEEYRLHRVGNLTIVE